MIRDGYCYCCVAYLPVVESPWTEAHKDKVKQYKEEIFHKSLFLLFTPAFLSAQHNGIDVQQFSGIKHHGVPIVGLWVADHPEQQLLALIDGSHCPWCLDAFNAWHDLSAPLKTRSVSKMQESFKRAEQLHQAGRYREYINCLKACGHTCNFQSVGSPFPPIPITKCSLDAPFFQMWHPLSRGDARFLWIVYVHCHSLEEVHDARTQGSLQKWPSLFC